MPDIDLFDEEALGADAFSNQLAPEFEPIESEFDADANIGEADIVGDSSVPPTGQQKESMRLGWRQVLNRFVADQDTPLMLMTMASALGRNPGIGVSRAGHIAEATRQGMVARAGAESDRATLAGKQDYNALQRDMLGVRKGELQHRQAALAAKKPSLSPGEQETQKIDAKIAAFVKHAKDAFGMDETKAKQFALAAVAPAQTPQEVNQALLQALQKIAATSAGTDITNPLAPANPAKMLEATQKTAKLLQSQQDSIKTMEMVEKLGFEVMSVDLEKRTITAKDKKTGEVVTDSY